MTHIEMLERVVKLQHDKLKFINKVMFETAKHQRNLSHEDRNLELLDLAWGTNDIIVDDPELYDMLKELKDKYNLTV